MTEGETDFVLENQLGFEMNLAVQFFKEDQCQRFFNF